MNRSMDDWNDSSTCIDCGATLWPDVGRAFATGPDSYLCFACAERRGGVYDASQDRWSVAPDVDALPDERRPHA
jgi:hypothetical protein